MIPLLYKSDSTDLISNCFGALSGTVECNVVEQINGVYELNMQILTDDPNFKNISIGSIIAAKPNLTTQNQAFVVESMSKPINNVVTIYATHIAQHRAKLIPVSVFSATSLTTALSGAMSHSLETNPFNLHSPRTSSADYEIVTPRSFREVLGGSEGSLLDVYGGEYIFNNFDIELVSKRGRDQGIQVVYGQNMTDFNMDEEFSWNGTATGVYPYWYTEEDGLVVGDIQYSPIVNLTGYQKTVTVDFTDKFENKPTKAELEAEALSYISNRGLNSVNIKVAFNQFEEHIRGDVLKMNLGDTVHIINSAYGVNLTSRIVSLDFNVLSENYNTIEIGELQTTINEAISDTASTTVINQGGGVTNYNELTNLPQINSVELTGNKSWADLGLTQPFMRQDKGTSTNLNDFVQNGQYTLDSNSTNAPFTQSGVLLVLRYSSSYVVQFATRITNSQKVVYMRKYQSAAGTPWSTWTSITFT